MVGGPFSHCLRHLLERLVQGVRVGLILRRGASRIIQWFAIIDRVNEVYSFASLHANFSVIISRIVLRVKVVFFMVFNQRVRQLREERGWTQPQAAQALGISYRNYQRLEAEGEKPQYDTFLRLADFYQVSADWLMCRTDLRDLNP